MSGTTDRRQRETLEKERLKMEQGQLSIPPRIDRHSENSGRKRKSGGATPNQQRARNAVNRSNNASNTRLRINARNTAGEDSSAGDADAYLSDEPLYDIRTTDEDNPSDNETTDIPSIPYCNYNGLSIRSHSEIKLPGLRVPPKLLEMFDGNHSLARRFLNRIRRYNNSNVFTSLGCSLEPRIFKGKGPPSFTIHGELRHRTGSIVPGEKRDAVFS